jgi:predicted CXXCH cytochrome family protein
VTGTLTLLPAQWDVVAATWEPLSGDGAAGQEWLPACGSCHVTGLNTETWGFTEFNLGCEACHGPGAAHASDPEHVKPYSAVDDQVCGACHSRGVSPDGHPFPATYRPGDSLADHFTYSQDSAALWPDGSAKANHQQYMDWQLGSTMQTSGELNCVTCHEVHRTGETPGQLVATSNELCLGCHTEQKALARHTPFHEQAIHAQGKEFLCTDCHMPLMATSATEFDLHNHSFLQPNPAASVEHGNIEAMPNACNRCHAELGEDAAWAAQTIAHVKEIATPSPSEFFGPGPTPTSPPPPTPIPATERTVVPMVVRPGWVYRVGAILAASLLGLVVLGVVVYIVHRRRMPNV